MERAEAFELFDKMIGIAKTTLFDFTVNSPLSIEHKADKSAVTECDKRIDERLTLLAQQARYQVVSEEGEHVIKIAQTGNYFTIDPIDGTLGYIEYVNYALEHSGLASFGQQDLGAVSDFCLLLGIVEDAKPRFGAVYNYITQEKIFLDAQDKNATIRENNVRGYDQKLAVYFDQRFLDDEINKKLQTVNGVSVITQAALGLKSVYTIINPHEQAATVHRVQSAGLWDIMPAAVAAAAYGGDVLDDTGANLVLNQYILLPGKGASILRGNTFDFVKEELKK